MAVKSTASEVCICVLCGLPGSGKTTLCNSIEAARKNFSFIHVCYDLLIPQLNFDDFNHSKTWKEHREEVKGFVKFLVRSVLSSELKKNNLRDFSKLIQDPLKRILIQVEHVIEGSCTKPVIFLIDDNMPYRSMRYKYCQVAQELQVGFCIIAAICPLSVCQERNSKRSVDKIVMQHSLLRINAQMEWPEAGKQEWEQKHCNVYTSTTLQVTVDAIIDTIRDCLENPMQRFVLRDETVAEQTRTINKRNFRHQADLILRKLCSEVLKSEDDPKLISSKLSLAKKLILNTVKSGDLDETDYLLSDDIIDKDALNSRLKTLLNVYLITLQ